MGNKILHADSLKPQFKTGRCYWAHLKTSQFWLQQVFGDGRREADFNEVLSKNMSYPVSRF